MNFLWSGLLALLVLLPILIAMYVWQLRRGRPSGVRYSSLALIRAAEPGPATRMRARLEYRTPDGRPRRSCQTYIAISIGSSTSSASRPDHRKFIYRRPVMAVDRATGVKSRRPPTAAAGSGPPEAT